jgi:hypothetical protein
MRSTEFDDMLVTLETPEQAAFWVNEFGVSLPTLMLALHKVGPRLNDVREELGLARIYVFPRDTTIMQRMLANGILQRG